MDRSQFIQVMRFFAAGVVLLTHATFYFHERLNAAVPVWHWGEVGVPIFFVISGIVMVMTTHNMPADRHGARAFILRRIVRIVPLWWFALGVKIAISLALPSVVYHNHFQLDHALKSFFFIPYFNEMHVVVPLHGVGWTLLHEMYFYVLFSLTMLCGLRPAAVTSAAIIAMWLSGLVFEVDNPFWSVATNVANLQFVIGMLVGSVLMGSTQAVRYRWAWGFGALALFLGALPARAGIHYLYPVVLAVGAGTLWLTHLRLPRALMGLTKLGDSSYSLYLFHPFITPAALLALNRVFPGLYVPLHIALAVVFTISLAHVIHLLIEMPLVRVARARLIGPPGPSRRLVRDPL